MPIKPENKSRYPKEWKQIRERILKRAGDKCEFCNVSNKKIIFRGRRWNRDVYQDDDGTIFCAENSERLGDDYVGEIENFNRITKVVLTIAHLDHTPENCSDDNLRALCQRCHLRYDKEHHAKNARETRKKKTRQTSLF